MTMRDHAICSCSSLHLLCQGEEGVVNALVNMSEEKVGLVMAEVKRRRAEEKVNQIIRSVDL